MIAQGFLLNHWRNPKSPNGLLMPETTTTRDINLHISTVSQYLLALIKNRIPEINYPTAQAQENVKQEVHRIYKKTARWQQVN
jgi:hypothetical protein